MSNHNQSALLPPKVMGILNVTPDSFSDGGRFVAKNAALTHIQQMIEAGADIIDIGGESTRPGAQSVPLQQELDRVIPILEMIRQRWAITISVDTRKAEVMHEAINMGADMINDIMALREEGSLATVATAKPVKVCLMHIQGEPRTMQNQPHYDDVVHEVKNFLIERIQACLAAGIAANRLIIDPGFGFGKTLEHNLQLFKHLEQFISLGYPVLIGVSRKSMIGQCLNKPPNERLYGGLALAVLAANQGVQIIRTHDVAATVDALKMAMAVL
jgi:dihydropteroate synthase